MTFEKCGVCGDSERCGVDGCTFEPECADMSGNEPVPPAGGEPEVVGYMQDRSDGEPLITLESHQSYVAELRGRIKDLRDHPSMSFHQVALLEGVLNHVPDGELVDRAHVTRLQADVERLAIDAEGYRAWGAGMKIQRDALQALLNERDEKLDALEARLLEIGGYAHDHSTGPAVPDALWAIRGMAYGHFMGDDADANGKARDV